MKHILQINIAKKNQNGGIVAYRKKVIGERILRLLLGNPVSVTVIVPGRTVEELNIKEIGGEA